MINLKKTLHYLREHWPLYHKIQCIDDSLPKLIKDCGAEDWHLFAIRKRMWRKHVCNPCAWIANNIPVDASIFEPGCGSGANLLWLAEKGFTQLSGADIQAPAVQLAQKLAKKANLPICVWQDNSLQPTILPRNVDVILSVNWLYHVRETSFNDFLRLYTPCLSPTGVIICDMIDTRYNAVTNNQYHTKDYHLPPSQRRASEYTMRLSKGEMANIADRHDLKLIKHTPFYARPQRTAYVFARNF